MTSVRIRENIRDLRPLVPGKAIEELRRERGAASPIIKLASNENPLGPGRLAMAALARELDNASFYPDPACFELREQLAQRSGLCKEQVCVGNGSEDILTLAASICVAPGSEVMFTECGFPTYSVIASKSAARAVPVPMRNFGHDLQAMLARVSERTALVFIDNPRNPTGTALRREEFVAFLKQIPAHVLVVLDEAYFEYHRAETDLDGASLVNAFDHVLVTRTFSKIHGLAGLRLGYGFAHAKLIEAVQRARMPFAANRLALAAASAALEDHSHLAASLATNGRGKASLFALFRELGLTSLPANGNFVTALLPFEATRVYDALLTSGIVIRALASFGLPQAMRVTIGSDNQLASFAGALRAIITPETAAHFAHSD